MASLVVPNVAVGQPILKRVEDLLRNQLDGAAAPGAEQGYFGLVGDDTTDRTGVQVLEVYPDQPAARAGLQTGDVITSLGGSPIRSMDDMLAVLANKPAGARLKVEVARSGETRLLDVVLGRKPAAAADEPPSAGAQLLPPQMPRDTPRPKLGVRTVAVTPQVQAQNKLADASGALVISVATGSPAEKARIPLGSVITAVNETPVRTPQELSATVQSVGAPEFTLTFVHGGLTQEAKVQLVAAPEGSPPPVQPPTPRPPQPALVAPADAPAAHPGGESRVDALERRIEELEARIKTLEAKQTSP